MSPFLILLVGVLFIVAAIIWLKMHPFFALVLAAVLVGVLPSNAVEADPGVSGWEQALGSFENSAAGLGLMAGKIGIVIALAAVIGQCLMDSGAADRITRTLLNIFGEKRASWALLLSGYCLSIPVFFDTVFFLLVPLARAMFLRTGQHYMSYVMAICAGGVITHGIVPPTPGPLLMAETLEIDLGEAILGGFLIGLPVAIFGGLVLPKILVARGLDLPLRETPGVSPAGEAAGATGESEADAPGFFISILPVALPVLLITAHSVWKALGHESDVLALLGNKNLAMFIATGVAMWLLAKSKGYTLKQLTGAVEPALKEAGVIILITAAGGAFGGMLKATGIGDTISGMVTGYVDGGEASGGLGILLIFIAWGSAAVMKIAQGSGTVAVITAAGIMAGVLSGLDEAGVALPYHKIYIFAAISFGAKVLSWMNDSGYWVVCKMSGFTEKETLKTWTTQLAAMGVFGLIEVLVLVTILPLK